MPSQARSVLGVDINQHEARIVEARVGTGPAQIVRAAYVPMPRGAVEGDRIVYPDIVAEALRSLLQRMGATTHAAIVGLGAHTYLTRVLDIPRVPDDEVRTVIEGELAHYQILREGTGAFDYLRLRDPEGEVDSNPQVLLMAAEERVVSTVRDVCQRAGLHLVALEPVLLAMCRACFPAAQVQPAAVCLAVSHTRAEIAIVDRGHIRLYRRVDIGADDLVVGRRAPGSGGFDEDIQRGPTLLGDETDQPAPTASTPIGTIVQPVAGALATEVQRSLDYYRREFPQAPTATRLLVAANDPHLDPLASWLGQALNLDAVLVEPPIASGVERSMAAKLEAPDGLRFLAAAGLAMREQRDLPGQMPRFDLSRVAPEQTVAGESRRRVLASVGVSAVIVLAGLVGSLALSRTAAAQQHTLDTQRARLLGVQNMAQARVEEKVREQELATRLAREGMPLPRIVDAIASNVDPESGLTEVSLDRTGMVAISGQASNEQSMIRTLDGIRLCPVFVGTTLDSFINRKVGEGSVVEFRLSSRLAGMGRPATR